MTEESSPPTGVDVSRDEFMRERIMTAVKDESRQLDELVLFGRRDCQFLGKAGRPSTLQRPVLGTSPFGGVLVSRPSTTRGTSI